jgi:hypothetical protein
VSTYTVLTLQKACMQVFKSDNQEEIKMKTSKLAALYFTCLLCIMSYTAAAQPFVISVDGSEVTDQKTGLIWRRCSEGMVVSGGTCTGTATTFTNELALARAKEVSSLTAIPWRLPNVKELSSIADKSLSNPAIDATAFPATPSNLFWSSSPVVGTPYASWYVYFLDGYVTGPGYTRDWPGHVRLVRGGQ